MKSHSSLTLAELLSLDVLITVAQQRGHSLKDRVSNTQEQAEAFLDVHQAMWDARHGGVELGAGDREIIAKMRELAKNLKIAPTLGELIELRGKALKAQG